MEQMFDTVIVAGSDKEWVITTHQNLIVGNCFEPPEILAGRTVDYGPLNWPIIACIVTESYTKAINFRPWIENLNIFVD